VGYIISASATMYLHYFGILAVVLQAVGAGILVLFRQRRWLLKTIAYYLVIGLTYIPWMPELLVDMQQESHFVARPEGIIWELFSFILYLFNAQLTFAYAASALILFSLGMGLWQWARHSREIPPSFSRVTPRLLIVLWWLVPFLIAYIRSINGASIFLHRYFLIMLPAVYLLVADGLEQIPLPTKIRTVGTLFVGALIIYNLIYGEHYYSRIHKQQFREAAQYVIDRDSQLDGESLIVGFTGVNIYNNLFDYYFEQLGWHRRTEVMGGYLEDIPAVTEVIDAQDPDYIWFVTGHQTPAEPFRWALEAYGGEIETRQFLLTQVWLYQNNSGDE
jgi:hypothetical protein